VAPNTNGIRWPDYVCNVRVHLDEFDVRAPITDEENGFMQRCWRRGDTASECAHEIFEHRRRDKHKQDVERAQWWARALEAAK